MKNLALKNSIRMVGIVSALLLAQSSFAQNQITMTMSDPTNVTTTSFEFDINVANTGTSTLKLSSGQPQIEQIGTNIPVSPTTPTYTVVYEGPVYETLNNPTPSYNNSSFRISQSPIGNNANAITMPTSATVEYHVKIQSNSGPITYPVTLKLRTTTPNITLVAYVGTSSTTTAFSLAAGNLVLGSNLIINAPTPVELNDIDAIAQPTSNLIKWSTSSEVNSQFHIVERSKDGIDNWSEIGRKNAAGTTTEKQNYYFTDEQPLAMSYYRLKLLDFDGKYEYSKVVSVERTTDDFAVLNMYPMPTDRAVTLQISLEKDSNLTFTVSDMSGRVLFIRQMDGTKGVNTMDLDVSDLSPGQYLVDIDNGITKLTQQLVKQ